MEAADHVLHHGSPADALHGTAAQSSLLSFSFRVVSVVALLLVAYAAVVRAWDAFLKWQERSYRLAMRRRHGIPDTDHRPFNVAHAAVLRARQERDKERSRRVAPQTHQDVSSSGPSPPEMAEHRNVMPGWLDRSPSRPPQPAYPFPSASLPLNDHAPSATSGAADRPSFSSPISRLSEPLQFLRSRRRSDRKRPDLSTVANQRIRQCSSDDDDYEPNKVMRADGRGFPTDDADSDVPAYAEKAPGRHRRGAKRLYDDDDMAESKRARGKRPRKVSKEHRAEDGEQMLVDEEGDEITALRSLSRGKKRDRTEAGSTFGGDDEDSVTGTDSDDGIKVRQRRKRRTVTKRKSEVHSRGKKRDRDVDKQDFDDEDSDWPKNRSKREKRYSEDEGYQGSDTSMDASHISQDPLCNGRRIGEEWEASGVRYKVGPNGERLRQALVKKARSKFVMPQDSQHPDRQAHLEVFVETWLTENQYTEARDGHQLAWQDSPSGSKTPDDVPTTPSKEGKDLLWSTSRRDSLSKAKPSRQSIATTVGLRVNPFQQPPTGPGRRVTSAFIGDLGSPRLSQRSFSKWEKQDLEAEAMARLRERKRSAEPVKPGVPTSTTSSPAPFATTSPATENRNTPSISFGVSPVKMNVQSVPEPSKAPVEPVISFNTQPSSEAAPTLTSTQKPSVPTFSLTPPSATLPVAQTAPSPAPSLLSVPAFSAPKVSGTPIANATSSPVASTAPAPSGFVQKPTFSFSPSGGTSRFSFGVSGTSSPNAASASGRGDSQKNKEQPVEDAKGSTSLLGRLGGFAAPDNNAGVTSPGPTFSFPKSTTTGDAASSKPISAFTPSTDAAATTTKAAPAIAGGTSSPKFNFGFGNKTNTTSAAPVPAATPTPVLNVASNSTSTFTFSQTPAQSKPPEPAKSTATKFNFAVSSGATSGNKNSVSGANQASSTKPIFGGFGGNQMSTTPSITAPAASLSNPTPATGSSIFGGTGWGSAAATTPGQLFTSQSPSTPASKTEAKSGFSFAAPSPTPDAGEAAKPSFSFNSSTTPATGDQKGPEFKFNFPQPPVFGAQTEKDSGSVFGKPGLATPSVFGTLSSKDPKQTPFGDPAPTPVVFGSQQGSIFGAALSSNGQAVNETDKSAAGTSTPAKSPFSFGTSTASPSFTFGAPSFGSKQP